MGNGTSFPERGISGAGSGGGSGARHSQQIYSQADSESACPSSSREKKKVSKFATLKKKLTRARRPNRNHDYGKVMRDLTVNWTIRELHSLIDEYEAAVALKELTVLADQARLQSGTIIDDLFGLYQNKYCTDVDLIYQGIVFPVHRAILCIRCAFFRELLAHYPEYGAQVPVCLRTSGVDVALFSALLRYLYTGDFGLEQTRLHCLKKLLSQLAHEFGAPNSLEQDMRTLLDTGAYSDAVLVFSSELDPLQPSPAAHGLATSGGYLCDAVGELMHGGDGGVVRNDAGSSGGSIGTMRRYRNKLRCHNAILAARSPFFRNLVLRRARSGEELTERVLHSPTYIVLDESVIPRRYARVLLSAIYLDTVDLSCIMRSSASLGTLSEVQAMVSGRAHLTATDEAMELFHIGRFLEITALIQGQQITRLYHFASYLYLLYCKFYIKLLII